MLLCCELYVAMLRAICCYVVSYMLLCCELYVAMLRAICCYVASYMLLCCDIYVGVKSCISLYMILEAFSLHDFGAGALWELLQCIENFSFPVFIEFGSW